ncbi:MAG: TraC family protein [Candidatus Peribacteraceae bacterium]|jgi:type IV secretory pathway VirB4 component|nr:TraC family protein [Candidatus Peribacteraceae bacterium]MDP7454723.1 TraC family protein [Candidatus Peribacteraceae bacterium]MDP7646155.1 TraC family protein [Candidatus Peribacteraceae bacterium]|tara:strand:- start:318 stop:1148 length:831 start_codon:yes stop_codon:yes gene_type:complete
MPEEEIKSAAPKKKAGKKAVSKKTGTKKKKGAKKGAGEEKKGILGMLTKTMRGRKRNTKATTQRYLPISEIRNDTVILKNNGLRAVLELEPINFNLKSEDEQQGIIVRYQNFLNTLSFPIQIVVTSKKVNIDPYIDKVRARSKTQTNKLLKKQSLEYAAFIEKLVDVADIMQKKFYVVVPQDDQPPKKNTFTSFSGWMKTDDSATKISGRNQRFHQRCILLRDRVNLIQSSLHNVGIVSKRMTTQELIELYYQMYNPLSSQEQKLPGDLNTEKLVI